MLANDTLLESRLRLETYVQPVLDYKPKITAIDVPLSEETVEKLSGLMAQASKRRIAKNAWFRMHLEGRISKERAEEIVQEELERELKRIRGSD